MTTSHQNTPRRWLVLGLLTTAVGIGTCAVTAWDRPEVLWRAYLAGLIPCWLVTLGAAGLLALGNLTGGRWAVVARPYYLAAMKNLPWVTLLLVPVAFGLDSIYPWARANSEYTAAFSPAKSAYLSGPFFLARAAGYMFAWLFVVWWLGSVSRLDLPPASTPAMRRAGALGLVLLVPTTTFAAFDWVMSLEPHWYSSIYGAILTAGGVLAAHALAIIGLGAVGARDEDREPETSGVYGDLGNLMLAFVMLWTYFSFSQFLIIWSANLPSEIAWYQRRLSNGWQFVAIVLALCCFAIPFSLLLARDLKRDIRRLSAVAAFLLVAYGLNMYWTIVPAFPDAGVVGHVANAGAMIGLGGLWFGFYCWHAGRMTSMSPVSSEYGG